ncbi:Hypothetical protein D9617_2g059930 [Elsinoe fawcettii]|nr:Hypothetical protein D9617_2g059930 [Elsinoe fawcettii]
MAARKLTDESVIALASLIIMFAMTGIGWLVTKRLMERHRINDSIRQQAGMWEDYLRVRNELRRIWYGPGAVMEAVAGSSNASERDWGIEAEAGYEMDSVDIRGEV